MHLDGARISTPETLRSSTILDCQWLLFILIARGRVGPVEGGVDSIQIISRIHPFHLSN